MLMHTAGQMEEDESAPHHGGCVAPGFEEVRDEFERSFAERGEIGAAVAAYEIIEARAERLDDVESLWRGMHEYHAEVASEASEVAPFRRAEDSWQRRRGEFERWTRRRSLAADRRA